MPPCKHGGGGKAAEEAVNTNLVKTIGFDCRLLGGSSNRLCLLED